MHRIVFTGTHSTGKTTVLKKLEENGYNVITEVVRQLQSKGVKINKDGDEKGQTKIFNTYKDLLSEVVMEGYISDRCLLDVLAYSVYLAKNGKVSEEFVNKQKKKFAKFVKENPDISYCYFPIEFDLVEDGIRDGDEEYRREIDENINALMVEFGIMPIVVKGTVDERVQKVTRVMNWLHEGISLYTGS